MGRTLAHALAVAATVAAAACAAHRGTSVPDGTLSGLPERQLDARFRPLALAGEHYVALGTDRELQLIETRTGRTERVTNDGLWKPEAALSDRYIAWIALPRDPSSDEISRGAVPVDVFLYDRRTRETRRVTTHSAPRRALSLQGTWLVWADKRNELAGDYTDYDIYGYDLEQGVERPLVVAPGTQVHPCVSGQTLVWQDNRKSPSRGTAGAGCENCPENRYDIYLRDLRSGEERVLAEDTWMKADPVISGNLVAWTAYRGWRLFASRAIVVLDLATGDRRTISAPGAQSPLLSGGSVLWVVRSACDVWPHPGNTGVYLQDLGTKRTRKLTSFVEPQALVSGRTVIIQESCQRAGRVYAVTLPE